MSPTWFTHAQRPFIDRKRRALVEEEHRRWFLAAHKLLSGDKPLELGEDVALHLADQLGIGLEVDADGAETVFRRNTFIAQTLTDRFGAKQVSTLWDHDQPVTRTANSRGRASSHWLHRVVGPPDRTPRVILDHSVTCKLLRDDRDALDVDRVLAVERPPKFSLAGGAFLELLDCRWPRRTGETGRDLGRNSRVDRAR